MPENTSNLDLYKVDTVTDGHMTFNIDTMLNENWDKIDQKAQDVDTEISGIKEDYKVSKALPFNPTGSNASVISYPDNLDPDDPTNGLFRPGAKGVEQLFNLADTTNLQGGIRGFTIDGNLIKYSNTSSVDYATVYLPINLKPNTQYTIIFRVSDTNNLSRHFYIDKDGSDFTTSYVLGTDDGIKKALVTTDSDVSHSALYLAHYNVGENADACGTIEVLGIYEGDQTNNPDVLIERLYGFATSALSYDLVSRSENKFNGKWYSGYIGANGEITSSNEFAYSDFIRVQPNDIVSFSALNVDESNLALYDNNQKYIANKGTVISHKTEGYTIPEGIVYVRLRMKKNGGFNLDTQGQLVKKSTISPTYEPYISDKTEFSIPWEYPMDKLTNDKGNEVNHETGDLDVVAKRVKLQSGDVTGYSTSFTNMDVVIIAKTSDSIANGNSIGILTDTNVMIEGYRPVVPNDDVSTIGGYYVVNDSSWGVVVANNTYPDLAAAQADFADKVIQYELAQPFSLKDGQQGYKAPYSIHAYQSGDLVVRPKIDFYITLNNETTITLEKAMIELEGVYAQLDDDAELELLPVTLNADGMSIDLTNAYDGLVHVKGVMHSKECLLPITTGNLAINIAAQTWDNATGVSKLNGDVSMLKENAEFVSRQIEGMKVITTKDLTISAVSWIEDVANTRWYYQITDADVTADSIVNANIHIGDLDKADMLLPVTESFNGYYRLYADTQPSENFKVDIVKQN